MSKDILLVTSGNEPDVKKTIAGQKSYRLQASMFLIRINDMHSLNSLDLPQHDGLSQVRYELNYASTVDSIAQGFDSYSHSFSGNDFNPSNYIFI